MHCHDPEIDGKKFHYICKIRKDHFGCIVLDKCDSDEDHLKYAEPLEGDDRARCRIVIEDLFESFIGKEGLLMIEISLDQHYKVVSDD